MILKTFDEILTLMCDAFDTYNVPNKVKRDDSNVIYLLLKAVSKGYEVINNVAVALSNKFIPTLCSDYDLASTAKLVGTSRLLGAKSALNITAKNTTVGSLTLAAGQYKYSQSDSVNFIFTLLTDQVFTTGQEIAFSAFSSLIGSYPVSALASMSVTRVDLAEIPVGFTFAGADNAGILGYPDESDLDFRKRINTDTTRQDTLKEMETAIRNLPYVFDCKLTFNQTDDPVTVDGVIIPPYYLLVMISGGVDNEIASIIASRGIFPTVEIESTDRLYYESDVFLAGKYYVFYGKFGTTQYDLTLTYLYDSFLMSNATLQAAINTGLASYMTTNTYTRYITEDMFYEAIKALNITSLQLLDVNIKVSSVEVPYVEIPPTRLPELHTITYAGSSI